MKAKRKNKKSLALLNNAETKSPISELTITSIEVAEAVGKPHSDLLKQIRKMEVAWEKVNEGKFSFVEYIDTKGEKRPMYQLTMEECLFIASKSDDEMRARLVKRWKELEFQQNQSLVAELATRRNIQAELYDISLEIQECDNILRDANHRRDILIRRRNQIERTDFRQLTLPHYCEQNKKKACLTQQASTL